MRRIQQSALESAFSGVYRLPELCVACVCCYVFCDVCTIMLYLLCVRVGVCVGVLCACCRRSGLEEEARTLKSTAGGGRQ